jgi:hypothetical protein
LLKCPLCNSEVEQFKTNSHILPEWMYKPLYAKTNPVRKIHLLNIKTGEFSKNEQAGYRDDFICDDCEKMFAKDDDYACKVLTDNALSSKERKAVSKNRLYLPMGKDHHEFFNWSGLDFKKLRKFVLSIILRTYLARNSEGSLLLSDSEYLKIRSIYYDETNLDDFEIPILLTLLSEEDDKQHLMFPYVSNNNNCKICSFFGSGFLFDVIVDKNPDFTDPENLYGLRLKSDGSLNAILVPLKNTAYFNDYKNAIYKILGENGENL